MNNYILIAIAVVILILLFAYSCKTCGNKNEYFHDYQAEFSSGSLDIAGFKSSSPNFRTIEMNSPSKNKFVLEQFNYDKKGLSINIPLEKNATYKAIYWRTNDNLYDAKNYDIQFLIADKKIKTKGLVTCFKIIDNIRWKKVEYVFKTNNNSNLEVIFGNVGIFTKGTRYYADFMIDRFYPELKDFKYQDNLVSFYNLSSDDLSLKKIFTDKTDRGELVFDNNLESNTYGASINNISGGFGEANKILGNKSTLIFTYMPEENQNGSLIYANAVNDYNLGLNIDMQTTYGVENFISIKIVDKNYIYNIGLISNPIIFILEIDNGKPILYINNHLTKPIKVNEPVQRQLGTCPDGFKAVLVDGIMKCQDISGLIPEGKCNSQYHQFNNYNQEQKQNWAKNICNVKWENCKTLNELEIAPKGNDSCIPNSSLEYSNQKIIINKDKSLTGRLHNIIIYNNILDSNTISDIYKYILLQLIKLKSEDNCCSRPTLIKESVSGIDSFCPFKDESICKDQNCKCVDWGDMDNLNNIKPKCKSLINKHCKNNEDDKTCNELREKKFGKLIKNVPNVSKRNSYSNTLSNDITKTPVIKNIANCDNCTTQVDLTKYIKKDKIPCWGCNLGDVDKSDKTKHSCNLKNL